MSREPWENVDGTWSPRLQEDPQICALPWQSHLIPHVSGLRLMMCYSPDLTATFTLSVVFAASLWRRRT